MSKLAEGQYVMDKEEFMERVYAHDAEKKERARRIKQIAKSSKNTSYVPSKLKK